MYSQYGWFKGRADWDRSKKLTAWSRVLLEKLTRPQMVKNFITWIKFG